VESRCAIHISHAIIGSRLTASSEIFLPSYVESNFESLERKRDPVHEIRLSDEEIKEMFPQ